MKINFRELMFVKREAISFASIPLSFIQSFDRLDKLNVNASIIKDKFIEIRLICSENKLSRSMIIVSIIRILFLLFPRNNYKYLQLFIF